jgi:hypothetical protein
LMLAYLKATENEKRAADRDRVSMRDISIPRLPAVTSPGFRRSMCESTSARENRRERQRVRSTEKWVFFHRR